MTLPFVFDDGGRAAAGFKGQTNDCVVRAIAIAMQLPYRDVYDELYERQRYYAETSRSKVARRLKFQGTSPRLGVVREAFDPFILDRGWQWHPTMLIGSGCKVHLADGELPLGRLIVRPANHVCAVIDGTIRDTYDPNDVDGRRPWWGGDSEPTGPRCVYGYFYDPEGI